MSTTDAADTEAQPHNYTMRLSRLTVDKLGVKLYDKASAVVAELVANAYDADAENVIVSVPLGTELATKDETGTINDNGYTVVVADDGHGMDPDEAQSHFLVVGADRRRRPSDGSRSRTKNRAVMGRKGIGKLAPFGICRRIEVRSAGGPPTDDGYAVSHFVLDFDKIVQDVDEPVEIDPGADDRTFDPTPGTTITLSNFLSKRVPAEETFVRQLARRFALAHPDFKITVRDTRRQTEAEVPQFVVPVNEDTKLDLADRPVPAADGTELPVTGWLAFGLSAYRNEEEAGVRIYARGKIVATTRDFEQPAGFTGEFYARSYLVGEIHAEWLDEDTGEDLVRTDRQGILWDSELGEALRIWGAALIKEMAARSASPRRAKKARDFIEVSKIEERARERYGDDEVVVQAVVKLGRQIGAFASEDELGDPSYVNELAEVILSVAPHQALITTFQKISDMEDKSIEDLLDLFAQTRIAEMASYAQIAIERVASINELKDVIDNPDVEEADLQQLLARAPWLVQPDWSVITQNQALKTFRDRFVQYWNAHHAEGLEIAISYERKRPDFTLVHAGRKLHVVELKKPEHEFADADFDRMVNYIAAFGDFFAQHDEIASAFPDGWVIDLIADGVAIKDQQRSMLYASKVREGVVIRKSWYDFIHHATLAHEQFLDARDRINEKAAN